MHTKTSRYLASGCGPGDFELLSFTSVSGWGLHTIYTSKILQACMYMSRSWTKDGDILGFSSCFGSCGCFTSPESFQIMANQRSEQDLQDSGPFSLPPKQQIWRVRPCVFVFWGGWVGDGLFNRIWVYILYVLSNKQIQHPAFFNYEISLRCSSNFSWNFHPNILFENAVKCW